MGLLSRSFLTVCLLGMAMAKPASEDNTALRAVSEGVEQFSVSLFKTISDENPGNLITSPLSVDLVLSMAAFGARGKTEEQMRNALRLHQSDATSLGGFQSLIDTLNNVKGVELSLANKIYLAENFLVKLSYRQIVQISFRSEVQNIDFSKNVKAADEINTWVKQKTNNRIDGIVSPDDLNGLTAAVLLNAVYFKGQWKVKFNPKHTTDLPFHVDSTTQKIVPTMYRQGHYKYAELPELKAKVIELPYKGDEVSMVIIVPDDIEGLSEVEQKLATIKYSDLLKNAHDREVQLYLPKFKIESKIELQGPLEKVGLTNMFTDKANFSGIADASLYVSKVVQKAFIEVNEEGSEAAAVTEVEMQLCALFQRRFAVDRPFLYSIVRVVKSEGETRTVPMFTGRLTEP